MVCFKERKGCLNPNRALEVCDFSKFIEEYNLVDIPRKGNIYSWYTGDDRSMSMIDFFCSLMLYSKDMV